MKKRQCKTCKWYVKSKNNAPDLCRKQESIFHACNQERSKRGNCGYAGKNWEEKT